MQQLYDYYYRFRDGQLHMPGRCRVRIYKRLNGTHTVLLTELASNTGESISGSCANIATDLVMVKRLNPKTTRWIQHDLTDDDHSQDDPPNGSPPQEDLGQVFDELKFTWSKDKQARDPQWQQLSAEEAMNLTGESLNSLARQLGDAGETGRRME